MTTRHCTDPRCGSFATGDSEWCRKHRLPVPFITTTTGDDVPGERMPDGAVHFTMPEQSERITHVGIITSDGRLHAINPDALDRGKHRKDEPRRRRSWRHPIRGMIVR